MHATDSASDAKSTKKSGQKIVDPELLKHEDEGQAQHASRTRNENSATNVFLLEVDVVV